MKIWSLKEINCPMCGSDTFEIFFKSTLMKADFNPSVIRENLKNTLGNYKKHSRIVKCEECGLVYANPVENFKSLLKGYEDVVDEEYLRTEKFRKITLGRHLEEIEKFKKTGKVLDIGCFAGFFLEIAKFKGWESYGIEPSSWAVDIAKSKKIDVVREDIEKANIPSDYFDVITMWDVIEHLPNPKKILTKAHKAVKRNGIIALGTPNINSTVAKILGSNNPYLIRMHLLFFSPETLGRMLDEAGFKTVKTYFYGRTFPISYILNTLKINNAFYKKFKEIINSSDIISNYPIHLNLHDSFVIIAKK